MLKRNFLSRVSVLALTSVLLGSMATTAWAMEDPEEGSHSAHSAYEEKEGNKNSGSLSLVEQLPEEILINIFQHPQPKTLSRIASVSQTWNTLSSDDKLWKSFLNKLGFENPNDLPSKQIVTSALKASTVNSIINESVIHNDIERFVTLGYSKAYGYSKDLETAKVFNDTLVAQGNHDAVGRKIRGLANGWYGYPEDLAAAKNFIDTLVVQGHPQAIEEKIKGLAFGWYGYAKDPEAAKAFNEKQIALGNSTAIKLKVVGLANGLYGYSKDLEAAKKLNEELVDQGNSDAIARKVEGLAYGKYGYAKDPAFLTNYINLLAE